MYMNTTYSTKQSAVAMRKRMSDDTNKYNFNRKRILDRIRDGSIPQQNTTKKYDMSNAEVNAIRKEGNHPPLVVAFAPSAYAPTLAINEETKSEEKRHPASKKYTRANHLLAPYAEARSEGGARAEKEIDKKV